MSNCVEQLETQLQEAIKASTPVTVETIKHDDQEKVTVSSHGTTRTDLLGGEPVRYLPGHVPTALPVPAVLPAVTKELGKLLKENEDERVVKHVSGTTRTDIKG